MVVEAALADGLARTGIPASDRGPDRNVIAGGRPQDGRGIAAGRSAGQTTAEPGCPPGTAGRSDGDRTERGARAAAERRRRRTGVGRTRGSTGGPPTRPRSGQPGGPRPPAGVGQRDLGILVLTGGGRSGTPSATRGERASRHYSLIWAAARGGAHRHRLGAPRPALVGGRGRNRRLARRAVRRDARRLRALVIANAAGRRPGRLDRHGRPDRGRRRLDRDHRPDLERLAVADRHDERPAGLGAAGPDRR